LIVGVFAVGLLLGWIVRGISVQSHDALTVATYGDWRLTCPPRATLDAPCRITQSILDKKSGSTLVQFAQWKQKDTPVLAIVVPFNVLLPPGIGLQIGDKPAKNYPYKTCDQNGCIATIAADEALYDALDHATQIRVIVGSLNGKAYAIALSARGLSDAASAMSDAEGKRHSWFRRAFL
jgi:invasion protein IalB